MNPFLLGSGFYGGEKEFAFSALWSQQLTRSLSQKPEEIVIISNGGSGRPEVAANFLNANWPVPHVIEFAENIGHVGMLLSGEKNHEFCGWSATVLALAMTAYAGGVSLLYVEQDCLIFGDILGQIEKDLGCADMVFGRAHQSEPFMEVGQSLFFIRHKFIPQFVSSYIQLGTDATLDMLPERKFLRIEEKFPDRVRRFSIPGDREKPVNFDLPAGYWQRLTEDELAEFRNRGML